MVIQNETTNHQNSYEGYKLVNPDFYFDVKDIIFVEKKN
jgi:hypothetical protein